MPEISIIVEGVKYILVHDTSGKCEPCAFCGRLGVCSTEKIKETPNFYGQTICRCFNGVWKKKV